MSFDIKGLNPLAEDGKYFGTNNWCWRPIWEYCRLIAPEITRKVEYAHSNDGDGLDAVDAKELGKILFLNIVNGETAEFIFNYKGFSEEQTGKCNLDSKDYPLDLVTLMQFSYFLKLCGGFEIW